MICAILSLAVTFGAQDLTEYAGYYELEGNHPVVISYRSGPGGEPILLFTDLKTDAIRALFPSGDDRFHFGPELIAPEPVVAELRFLRSDAGAVAGLELAERGLSRVSGGRVVIETQPVAFEREGVELEGTLFLPPGKTDPAPGILFAHGSEDEGQRTNFDSLPWVMAHEGFVALAYDKRGTGASTGSWHVGLDVLARDAIVALGVMRAHERVDGERIGILGTSEGGWMAPLIARMDGKVAFLVALYGGGMTKGDTFLHKHQRRFVEAGLTGTELEEALAEKRALVAASRERVEAGTGDGFDLRISYDPAADWKSFDGAVLALMGDADVLQDTPACAAWLRKVLAESKSPDWEVKVFPLTHHGMFLAREGGTAEFQELHVSHKVPGYWPTLLRWLDDRY
jgi:dienelactone hydrolase